MKFIDEKFKDEQPEITVKKIIEKLSLIGIDIDEEWYDSKIENCYSLRVTSKGKIPGTNGKGVSKAFARASAYGEFMERLESGLFFYKFQSFDNDESVLLHAYAPDKRYMTKAELLENSEWMESIVKKYGVTKEHIANLSSVYACGDRILTVPYYSLFEDKYVYLPVHLVEHIYSSNGCCVGNTREEAWIHALSEIFERNSNIEIISSGKAVPVIPREKLSGFDTVNSILDTIEAEGIYDIEILDCSCGKQYPVIATRIINKKTKEYVVKVGADPVFEIAVERTLTEIFQGRNIERFTSNHGGRILNKEDDVSVALNVINQLETGRGLFTANFFVDSDTECADVFFPENRDKTNLELLKWVVNKFKEKNLQVYIRNNSFLGFQCYKFVVPGYSEARGDYFTETVPTYYFGDRAAKTLRNIKKANIMELSELLMYHKMIWSFMSRKNNYAYLAGLPIADLSPGLASIHLAYAALKLKNYKMFESYIQTAAQYMADEKDKDYLLAVNQWITFMNDSVDKEKALSVIEKFYFTDTVKRLEKNLKVDSLLDEFLVVCEDCSVCKYKEKCCYDSIREMTKRAGIEYSKFVEGQDKCNFAL